MSSFWEGRGIGEEETNYVCLQRLFCFPNITLCTFSENKIVVAKSEFIV